MDVDIIDETENPMLHRTDVRFEVVHDDASPSRLSVRDSLAAKLNKDASEVVVHKLDTKFGMRRTVGYAKVYDDSQAAADVEQSYMLERNKITVDGDEVATEPAEETAPESDDDPDVEDAEDDPTVEDETAEPEGDGEPDAEEEGEGDVEEADAEADAESEPEEA